jgi:DNA-binding response OmpR family regulator
MSSAASRPLEGVRVLVVEDEYFIADDLARALRAAGAVPVGPVASVEDAEAMLDKERPDAAILDLNLRGVIAGGLVERVSRERLPTVVVSGYSERGLPELPLQLPRLEKPVDCKQVVERLAEELSKGPLVTAA